jgi:hypothetical protein
MATLAIPAPARPARSPYAWVSDGVVRDWYFLLLLLLAPVQSVLVTPVQGTTPAFLLTLGAAGALIGPDSRYPRILGFYAGFLLVYSVYLLIGLSGYTIDQPDLSQLTVIREVYVFGRLKQTHITQGLYLLTALLFAYAVYLYYQEAFLKWAFYGILALAAYGFYEFVFYALFHANGDFLSNRNFGDLDTAAAGGGEGAGNFATGSMLQQSNLFGPRFMRLKSLVGEPSMYAVTVTPFAVYAFGRRWWVIFGVLLVSLVFSTSTTAVIGLAVGLAFVEVRQRQEFVLYIGAFVLVAALLYATAEPVQRALDTLLFGKLDTGSGSERLTSFVNHASVVLDGNPVRALFGLGFGTVRATDMMSNLLANVGVVGFLGYSAVILAPCFMLRRAPDRTAIIATLLAIWFMEMLTVSEYAYLPPWFMVALGYARARQARALPALPAPGFASEPAA